MKNQKTKKLIFIALLSCISYVLSSFVYFPRMAPFQHMMNVIAGVMLGPIGAFASAFLTGVMRMLLGGRTIQAIVGAVVGAFLSGLAYKLTKKNYMAVVGEVIGTGIIGALLVYPLMVKFYGLNPSTPFWTFIPSYLPSSLVGACLGFALIKALKKAKVWQIVNRMLVSE